MDKHVVGECKLVQLFSGHFVTIYQQWALSTVLVLRILVDKTKKGIFVLGKIWKGSRYPPIRVENNV